MPDEKPLRDLLVGDRFWLGYAQEMVKAAVAAPDRRAEQLSNGIAWFWTVYSAAVLVVFTTRTLDFSLRESVLLALPTVVLIFAYWMASRVRVPIQIQFDPRVPSEIEAAHQAAVVQKNRTLAAAEFLTSLAAACVVIAVVVALFTAAPVNTELHGSVGPGSDTLLLLGTFPREGVVRVSIRALKPVAAPAQEISQLHHAAHSGELRAAVAVPAAEAYRVSATWSEEDIEKSIAIQVKRAE